jgi:hypothetical protein
MTREKAWVYSTRVPDHAFLAWRMVVYIYYTTAAVEFHQLAAGQLLSGQGKVRRYGPSITYKIPPAGSLYLQPARRAAVLCQSSSFRSLWLWLSNCPCYHEVHTDIVQCTCSFTVNVRTIKYCTDSLENFVWSLRATYSICVYKEGVWACFFKVDR